MTVEKEMIRLAPSPDLLEHLTTGKDAITYRYLSIYLAAFLVSKAENVEISRFNFNVCCVI